MTNDVYKLFVFITFMIKFHLEKTAWCGILIPCATLGGIWLSELISFAILFYKKVDVN